MIKSVTYLNEDKKSYELSDESDIQALDTSVAEGSVARVTGKITAEYELREGNWVKTAGGSGGGVSNMMRAVFSFNGGTGTWGCDKTFEEITTAIQNGDYVYGVADADGASEFMDVDKSTQRYVCFSKCQIIPTSDETGTKDYIVYNTYTVRVDNVVSSTVARHPLS